MGRAEDLQLANEYSAQIGWRLVARRGTACDKTPATAPPVYAIAALATSCVLLLMPWSAPMARARSSFESSREVTIILAPIAFAPGRGRSRHVTLVAHSLHATVTVSSTAICCRERVSDEVLGFSTKTHCLPVRLQKSFTRQ